ncbi:programmed cell death protein 2 isoform X2 [Scyliorhinus canicula]|uniref:programmed cell death protein 2 isoform X2 n=1 Tax=Scyliorhinus canicula TaxID=7830 RepID=UPI0018F60393|nr:programmed cell death protein 2 isoform X2 [Scyliorhinus canicula]
MAAPSLAMAPHDETSVELGFVEPAAPARLLSSQFPSKVGGRPAWLSLQLPVPERLLCGGCRRPMVFLLQVYAPRDCAFHRALLIFCCAVPACPRRRFAVFRSQLGRINDFYGPDPEPEPEPEALPGTRPGPRLCRVCGASAPKSCSRCRWAHYCGKEHQSLDWKAGHREACGRPGEAAGSLSSPNILFPEFELVMELEDSDDQKLENLKCLESMSAAESDCVTEAIDEQELEAMAKHESKEDRIFAKFKRRVALAPDQVLRYCRGGCPLWVSGENIPSKTDIPNCPCGAKREFEFQVMPQLLNYLKVDCLRESLDWGTLCVYTCEQSCDHGNEYCTEFLWKQDFSAEQF